MEPPTPDELSMSEHFPRKAPPLWKAVLWYYGALLAIFAVLGFTGNEGNPWGILWGPVVVILAHLAPFISPSDGHRICGTGGSRGLRDRCLVVTEQGAAVVAHCPRCRRVVRVVLRGRCDHGALDLSCVGEFAPEIVIPA